MPGIERSEKAGDVHPLEGGSLRLKFRHDRRSGLPRESALRFYPRYIAETIRKLWGELSLYREWTAIRHEVTRDPNRWSYTDLAIAPPREDDLDTLDLYHATRGGVGAAAAPRRDPRPRRGSHARRRRRERRGGLNHPATRNSSAASISQSHSQRAAERRTNSR